MVIIFHNSSSFKYKSSLITNRNGVKITVLLKYLSNFWRSLEMRLINCKIELSLSLDPNCVLSNLVQASIFTITDAKLYVPIVLRDKAFKIASDPKYDGYQRGLASMVYNFFDKKSSGSGVANEKNHQLSDELHKQIIKEFNRRKLYSLYRDNIWVLT